MGYSVKYPPLVWQIEETMAETTTYEVIGMTCNHCVRAVTQELENLDGVTSVSVDLGTGAVTVVSDRPLERDAIAAAVDEAGYSLS